MRIETTSGTIRLDDAIPSADDMNDIISSITRWGVNGEKFQALCDASAQFPEALTNEQFLAHCEAWLANN